MRKGFIVLCMVVGALLLSSCGTCLAEAQYTITETELTQLESNIATLKQQRSLLQTEFTKLKIQQERLDKQVTTLENQLAMSKSLSNTLEMQLSQANKFLDQYAKEEKAKINKYRLQRTIAYTLLIGVACAAISR